MKFDEISVIYAVLIVINFIEQCVNYWDVTVAFCMQVDSWASFLGL